MAKSARPSVRKKSAMRHVTRGIVHVQSNFNNTIVTITDEQGNKISGASAGSVGNKNSRKGTPHGAEMAAKQAGARAKEHGMKAVIVKLTGPGSGRDSAVRALHAMQFEIEHLIDVTPNPHNGCRPPKRRRV